MSALLAALRIHSCQQRWRDIKLRFALTIERWKWLRLIQVPITTQGLARLEAAKNLEQLDLWGTNIDDLSFALISQLPRLRVLTIRDGQWTEEGLKHLATKEALEILSLSNSGVSKQSIENLRSTLPNLKDEAE